jgi:hypothetical protein
VRHEQSFLRLKRKRKRLFIRDKKNESLLRLKHVFFKPSLAEEKSQTLSIATYRLKWPTLTLVTLLLEAPEALEPLPSLDLNSLRPSTITTVQKG